MKYIYFFAAFSFTTLTSVAHDAAYLIAQKYGLQNWNKVESITYTFNVKNPRAEFGRTWTWHPKEDKGIHMLMTLATHAEKAWMRKSIRTSLTMCFGCCFHFKLFGTRP